MEAGLIMGREDLTMVPEADITKRETLVLAGVPNHRHLNQVYVPGLQGPAAGRGGPAVQDLVEEDSANNLTITT